MVYFEGTSPWSKIGAIVVGDWLNVFDTSMMASIKAQVYLDEGLSDVVAGIDDLVPEACNSDLERTLILVAHVSSKLI